MTKRRLPLIPLSDYQRIFRITRSVLDSVEANTSSACPFFSAVGAAILNQFYKKNAFLVAGAAFYHVNNTTNTVISLGKIDGDKVDSTQDAFHAWILCDGYAIDFMAPIFQESLESSGHQIPVPRRMFQKHLDGMSQSHLTLYREGDFYLKPNVDLTQELLQTFSRKPSNIDLLNVCLHWFKRPPKSIQPQLPMINDLGEVTNIKLNQLEIVGAW